MQMVTLYARHADFLEYSKVRVPYPRGVGVGEGGWRCCWHYVRWGVRTLLKLWRKP